MYKIILTASNKNIMLEISNHPCETHWETLELSLKNEQSIQTSAESAGFDSNVGAKVLSQMKSTLRSMEWRLVEIPDEPPCR